MSDVNAALRGLPRGEIVAALRERTRAICTVSMSPSDLESTIGRVADVIVGCPCWACSAVRRWKREAE